MVMTQRASYTSAAAFEGLGFVLMTVLGLVSSVVTARLYGIEVIGEFALATAPVTAVWYLSTARERPAFVRELATLPPRAPRVTGLFAAVLSFSFAVTALVAAIAVPVVIALFHGPVDRPSLVAPTLAALAGHLVATNTGWNLDAVFAGFRASRELFWIRLHQVAVFLAVSAVLWPVTDSVWGLVLATMTSYCTSLVHRLVRVRRYMRLTAEWPAVRDGFRTLPGLIRFGVKLIPGGLAQGAGQEVGTWSLGMLSTVSTVGAYSRAWTLARRLTELNWRINEMLLPTLVERRRSGDRAGFDRAFVDTVRYCVVALLLVAAAGGGAAASVMAVFGPGFERGAGAFAVLLLVPAVVSAVAVQRQVMLADDRPGLTSIIAVAGALVTTGATVVLTLRAGITGTAAGLLAGSCVEAAWLALHTRRHVATPLRALWPPREAVPVALGYAAGFAAAHATAAVLPGLAGLLPALAAGSSAYLAALVAGGGVNERDRARLAALARWVRARRRRRRIVAATP
jgi:O-antigen/teichoic acid export membrane protein